MKLSIDKLKQLNPLKGKTANKNAGTPRETHIVATDKATSTTSNSSVLPRILTSRRNKIIAAVVVCYLVLFGISCAGTSSTSLPDSGTKAAEIVNDPVLAFTVDADSWDTAADGNLVVKISGTTSNGEAVNEQYKAVPDTKYQTDLKAGKYTIALASTKATEGSNIFKADPVEFTFDAKSDKNVVLKVTLDEEAIEAEEAEKKAAEEKAAAEQKAAEEKAAAEKAAAEAAAAAAVASSTSGSNATSGSNTSSGAGGGSSSSVGNSSGGATGGTVYLPSSGKKYHSNPNCSGMKNARAVSVSEAQNQGYTPCSKCW